MSSTADDTTTDLPGIDTSMELLKNERRRRILATLQDGPADFGEIVATLARAECGPVYSSGERKRVYISLYQVHVPRLVEADCLRECESGYELTARGRDLAELAETLEGIHGGDRR